MNSVQKTNKFWKFFFQAFEDVNQLVRNLYSRTIADIATVEENIEASRGVNPRAISPGFHKILIRLCSGIARVDQRNLYPATTVSPFDEHFIAHASGHFLGEVWYFQ